MAYDVQIKQLVIARLSAMPPNVSFSIGQHGTFSREDLIKEVNKNSKTGEAIVKMELEFIKRMPLLSASLTK